jgi:FkbM family methyltransferase
MGIVRTGNEYYHEEQSIFRSFKDAGLRPEVIFAVGSAQAGWSRSVSLVFPEAQFHVFEPLVGPKQIQGENTDRALPDPPRLSRHSVALGAVDGRNKTVFDGAGGSATTLLRRMFGDLRRALPARIYRLETIVSQLNLPRPDVMKLDAPGVELEVLTGAGSVLDSVQVIQLKSRLTRRYRGRSPLLHEVIEFLGKKKFSPIDFGGFFFSPIHELCALDVYFARADLLAEYGSRLSRGHLGRE